VGAKFEKVKEAGYIKSHVFDIFEYDDIVKEPREYLE
jgi:hypothetical protein